jgi:hypothetical protein
MALEELEKALLTKLKRIIQANPRLPLKMNVSMFCDSCMYFETKEDEEALKAYILDSLAETVVQDET